MIIVCRKGGEYDGHWLTKFHRENQMRESKRKEERKGKLVKRQIKKYFSKNIKQAVHPVATVTSTNNTPYINRRKKANIEEKTNNSMLQNTQQTHQQQGKVSSATQVAGTTTTTTSASSVNAAAEINKYVFSAMEVELLEKNGWLDVKEKAERLVIAYELKQMPVIRKTIDLLNLMLKATLESFTQSQISFFIDEILFTVIRNVIEHKEYQFEDNYLIAEQIIIKTLQLISQSVHLDIPKLSEILAFIFNTQRCFYSRTILLKSPPQHEYPLGYEFERNEERKKWEEELKIGDLIDCIKLECFQKRQSWSRAIIERMDDTSISVKYLNDSIDDKIFNKSSYQIAPYGQKSTDFEWREQLKVNDEIDFADSFNIWQNATVLDSKVLINKNGETEKQIYVGMRIFREDGDRYDAQSKQNYFGWNNVFDEWISPHSSRIQKFNRLSRQLYQPTSTKTFFEMVDDASDICFEQENSKQTIYAIQRGDKNNNFVRYINHFGAFGGFDNILKRFQNYSDWCPLEIQHYYLESFTNIHNYFFLDFARQFIPPLWEAVHYLLMNPSEFNLRTYDKERLESIIGSLETLLKRVFNSIDQIKFTEDLSMNLALKCYQTDVLKQRIAGLKLICEIIKYVKQNSYKSVDSVEIKPPKFVEWIQKNSIIEDLYINNIHSELINRSGEFFKFMLNQSLLTESLAREMFNAIERQDQMTKQGFLKLLGEISSEPKRSQAKYIIQNIQRTEAKELTIEHIEVIYELALFKQLQPIQISSDEKKSDDKVIEGKKREGQQNEEVLLDTSQVNKNTIDALYYFYELIICKDFTQMSSELKAKIIDRFCCLIRIEDGRTQRMQFLVKCIDDIKMNVSVNHLLQIIKQIIGTYYAELSLKNNNTNNIHSNSNGENNNNSNNNSCGNQGGQPMIKLHPSNDDQIYKLNYPDESNNNNNNDSKKRNINEKEGLQQIVEEETIEVGDLPQKKKSKTDCGNQNSTESSTQQQQQQQQQAQQHQQNSSNEQNNGDNSQKINNSKQDQAKSMIAYMLVNEYKLVDTILQNIRQVKVNYRKKLDNSSIGQNERKELLKQFHLEISERIDFIKFINSILEDEKKIITTPFLCSVWKDIVENPLDIDERDLLYKWLRELADEKGQIVNEVAKFFKQQLMENVEFVQHLSFEGFLCYKAMFISLNLQANYLQQQQIPKSNYTTNVYGAICSLSGGPNNNSQNCQNEDANGEFEYLVLIEPSILEGMDLLWEIVYKNGLEVVIENSIDFLVKLHLNITTSSNLKCGDIRNAFISECMSTINTSIENNQVRVKRTIEILQCLLNESEKKGIGYLKPLNGLVKGEVQNLTITNDITYVQEGQKKQDIKIESNKTIIDLKILIASKVNSSWDQIKIKRSANFKQLRDSDNSRTIGEIRFKSNENLTIERRQTPPIPEANLLNPDGSLVDKIKQIFKSWFEMFSSSEGLMDSDNLAKFIHSCTNDNCRPDDTRVTGTISTWDHDKDGKLDLQDFLNFYRHACQEKKTVVWKNLHYHNYRNDLKKLSEVGEDIQDIDFLPRNIIMQNPKFYELMIGVLDNDQISENVINLLNRLPASPDLVKKILNLEGVKGKNNPDWSMILDTKNSYRLLYTLTIIEYLMEDNESQQSTSDEQNQAQQEQKTSQEDAQESNSSTQQQQNIKENAEPNKKEEKNNQIAKQNPTEDILKKIYSQGTNIDPSKWREEFIQCGGFDQLFKVFIQYSQQDYSKLGINTKNILSFILRIMKNYLTAVFANKVTHLYKINQYAVQVKYSLDVINENLKKADEFKDGGEEEEKKQEEQKDQKASQENQQKETQTYPQVIPFHPNVLEQSSTQNSSAPIVGAYSKINFSIWANRTRVKETPDFLILKEKLSGKLGQKIMDTLDIESMLDKIVEILFNVISIDTELESEDRVIIDFCWCIIIDIVLYDSKQCERLTKYSSSLFSCLIMKGLFTQNLNVRRVFSHALYLISRQDQGIFSGYLLDLLMKNVPSSKDISKSDCNQYYELLCKIIEESKHIENVSINFSNLINDMILNIQSHISQESRYNAKNDKMLIGFLNMCEKILKIEPTLGQNLESFADYLFDVCLFCKNPESMLDENLDFEEIQKSQIYEFNPAFYVKCKSSDSRRAAYKILISILKSNKSIFQKIIKDGLNVLIDTLVTPSGWNYRPSNEQKCHQNYLGIKNLSQICYMNSMLQQFYMTKTFRYAILAANDQIEPNLVEYRGIYIDDNVLHQIQKMFAFLDLSDRQDYNPTGFCFSFKDYAGQPINVGVQQDAQEFLNMIFEKLETSLKQSPYKYILESIFGGQTISQMICSSCGNIKAKHELFYTQQLRVEGCKTISESFQKMIEGETISDFKCDACEKKCDQSRRICFSQLPNILIIQLQRIVFDLDTFVNKKINTKLEFPHNLDLKEYTVEYLDQQESELKVERKESNNSDSLQRNNLKKEESQAENASNIHPPEYYKYRLKGVTVHQGTAELGHYYSYINYKEDKWLEFNDSKIREFNPQNIEQECFGGQQQNSSDNYWEKGENSKNAYILVYERELKTPLKIVTQDEEQKMQVEKSLSIKISEPQGDQQKDQEQIAEIDYYSINQRIPLRQFVNTWLDNHNFMLEKHIYSTEFVQFLQDLIQMVEKPKDYIPSITSQSIIYKNYEQISEEDQKLYYSTLQMCAKLFFNIFYKSIDFEILKDLLVQMKAILDLIPQYTYKFAQEFIFGRFKQIEAVLSTCSEPTVRTAYSQIIVFTINNMINYYNLSLMTPQNYFIENENNLTEGETAERDILNYLDKLIEIKHTEISKNWLRMQQYLEIFRDFSYGGDNQVEWCFSKEMIARLIDFFLGSASPLDCYGKKKHEIGNRFVATPFGPLLQCVSYLISKVKWNINSQRTFTFSNNDMVALNNWEFYWKSMQENYDSQSICYIGQLMSHKDKGFSQSFGRLILKGINKANCDHIKQYLDLMSSYLSITDEYQQNRIEWIFGYANIKINQNDSYEMKLNLDEQIVQYETKLKQENMQPVLNILYHYRKLQENLCLHILLRVLLMCKNDQQYRFLNYLMKLPGPSYCCAHYLSWVRSHLENIICENQKSMIGSQKELLAKQCLTVYEDIEKVINQYAIQKQNEEQQPHSAHSPSSYTQFTQSPLSTNNESATSKSMEESSKSAESSIPNGEATQEINKDEQKQQAQQANIDGDKNIAEKCLKSLWPNYIVGKTLSVDENAWMLIGEDSKQNEVYLKEMEYTLLYTDSKPNGSTNLIFPEFFRFFQTILLSALNLEESNIKDFLYIYDPNSIESNNQINSSNKNGNKNSPSGGQNGSEIEKNGKKEDENSPSFSSAQQYLQGIMGNTTSTSKPKDKKRKVQEMQEMFNVKKDKNSFVNDGDDEDEEEDEDTIKKNKKEKHRLNLYNNLHINSDLLGNLEDQNNKTSSTNANANQLQEMQQIQNNEPSDKDATDSYQEEASFDSNKARLGDDFSQSGLPSTSNYGLSLNNDDETAAAGDKPDSADAQRGITNNQDITQESHLLNKEEQEGNQSKKEEGSQLNKEEDEGIEQKKEQIEDQEKGEDQNRQTVVVDDKQLIDSNNNNNNKNGVRKGGILKKLNMSAIQSCLEISKLAKQNITKINCDQAEQKVSDCAGVNQCEQQLVCVKHVLNVKTEVGKVIKRFLIENTSDSIANVQVTFTLQDENNQSQINQHMPYEISLEVQPKSTLIFFSTRKINPLKDWSEYTISAECQFINSNNQSQQQQSDAVSQQKDSQSNQQSDAQKKQDKNEEATPQDKDTLENTEKGYSYYENDFSNADVQIGPQLPNKSEKDYSGIKACNVCTFVQSSINTVCEICESILS